MNINDRVTVISEFIDPAWVMGRKGTIIRKRDGARGPVYGVHMDNTTWILDFDETELEHLHAWVFPINEQRGWIASDLCTTCGEVREHVFMTPHAIREQNDNGWLDPYGNDIDFTEVQ